jgi:predicted RNase H-like nuclease
MKLVGVDGCKAGWVAAELVPGEAKVNLRIVRLFADAVRDVALGRVARLVADIPIGLMETEPRRADLEARRLLGIRGVCVFPAPYRSMLAASSYQEAGDLRAAIDNRRISKQGFELLPKIREVDAVMTPELQESIREGHPELSFYHLAGGSPLLQSKKSSAGRRARLCLLERFFGERGIPLAPPPKLVGSRPDDILDALAMLASAWRMDSGNAVVIPATPQVDSRGLRAEMVA